MSITKSKGGGAQNASIARESNAYSCNQPMGDIHPGIITELTSRRVGNKTHLQVQARAIRVQKAKSCKN